MSGFCFGDCPSPLGMMYPPVHNASLVRLERLEPLFSHKRPFRQASSIVMSLCCFAVSRPLSSWSEIQ